jgi:hypothetical protein
MLLFLNIQGKHMATKKAKKAPEADQPQGEVVIAYKGFDKDFVCHPDGGKRVQYAVGQTFELDGVVKACNRGFHACEDPLHVFRYYRPATSRFAIVEQSGQISRHDEDSKVASSRLTVKAEISIAGLIKAAVEYRTKKCKPADGAVATEKNESATASGNYGAATASGYYGAATASGYYGAATASGDYGAATASGNYGAATASGDYGAATASGNSGAATASGNYGAATASGNSGAATASGNYGAATASGDYGAATASGDSGAATASGYYGAATASGYYGAATASGDYGAATASGNYGAATASGNYGAATASGNYGAATASGNYGAATADNAKASACAPGRNGKAKGIDGAALFLTYRDDEWNIVHACAFIVGRDGIKADTFYRLNSSGEPITA